MKSNEFVEIKVIFKKETLNEMNQYVLYQNLRNEKAHRKDKPIDLTVEDFITGCVNAYLNKLEYINTPPLENFTKPYHLKNHFKELMEKRKLKQKDICEATEIAAPIISRILANENQPSLENFIQLWIFFNCPPLNEVLYREE